MIMVGQIASLSVYVHDLERAVRFYVDQLDFEKRSETPSGSETQWVTLTHAGGETELILTTLPVAGRAQRGRPEAKIGSFTGFVFSTEDIDQVHDALANRGVKFANTPKREGWGSWAQFEDLDGNTFLLMQAEPTPVIRIPRSSRP